MVGGVGISSQSAAQLQLKGSRALKNRRCGHLHSPKFVIALIGTLSARLGLTKAVCGSSGPKFPYGLCLGWIPCAFRTLYNLCLESFGKLCTCLSNLSQPGHGLQSHAAPGVDLVTQPPT